MKRIIIPLVVVLALAEFAVSQQNATLKHGNAFESLAEPDSLTRATVVVHQDKRIETKLSSRGTNVVKAQNTVPGYRVQVFSSNTQRTAKADAFRIEKMIREEFPSEAVYVNYTSPFWKVRVGDFRTQTDAQSFRKQLVELFPNLKKEAYVVKEQIVISK
ncbi:MAG TPA: SPOR domain-containing protein [Paludibacter sp.]|nr:SPOR domain-containing protein [Paludibacter sp.]